MTCRVQNYVEMSYNKIKVANITNLGFRNFGNGRAAKGARKRHHMGLDLVFDPIKPQVYEMPLTVRKSAAAGVCVYNIIYVCPSG